MIIKKLGFIDKSMFKILYHHTGKLVLSVPISSILLKFIYNIQDVELYKALTLGFFAFSIFCISIISSLDKQFRIYTRYLYKQKPSKETYGRF